MIREYIYFVDYNPNGTSGMTDEEIVRCRDCAKWLESSGICMWDKSTSLFTKADDFCSYGEREGE